jgi:hypothetical protein
LPESAVFLRARDLTKAKTWLDGLQQLLGQELDVSADRDVLQLALAQGVLCTVIDGLDEIAPDQRRGLGEEFAKAIADQRVAQLLLSCRPVGAPSSLLRRLYSVEVPPLDRERAAAFLLELRPEFQGSLDEVYELSGANPLLLRLLAELAKGSEKHS